MKKLYSKIKIFFKNIFNENQREFNIPDPYFFMQSFIYEIKSGELNKLISDSLITKLKFYTFSTFGIYENNDDKLLHMKTHIYYSLKGKKNTNAIMAAINNYYKDEEYRGKLYRISQRLLKSFVLLSISILFGLIFYIFDPSPELKILLTISLSFNTLIFATWEVISIRPNWIHAEMSIWLELCLESLKNKKQELTQKAYESFTEQLKQIKSIVFNISKNFITTTKSKEKIFKTAFLKYHTDHVICSLFQILIKNDFISKNTEIVRISSFLQSIFVFTKLKSKRSPYKYLSQEYNTNNKYKGETIVLLKKVKKQIQNNQGTPPQEYSKKPITVPAKTSEDAEFLIQELKSSNIKIIEDNDVLKCFLEVFFTEFDEKTERIKIDIDKYDPSFLLKICEKIDVLSENAL
jgi:hypothetical protein